MSTAFNVIVERDGKFIPYDVIPYLTLRYNDYSKKVRPSTIEEFKEFITKESTYKWWARCEYEIILSDWPNNIHKDKWDVHRQVIMNLDIITELLMKSVLKDGKC